MTQNDCKVTSALSSGHKKEGGANLREGAKYREYGTLFFLQNWKKKKTSLFKSLAKDLSSCGNHLSSFNNLEMGNGQKWHVFTWFSNFNSISPSCS